MKEQYSVPVVLIVFNRPGLAEKMLECLKLLKPKRLFVISDGPREKVPGEKEKVEQVRGLFKNVPWPCEVQRNYAEKNMGCDDRVPSGLNWVFSQVERAVILEDDCIPSPQFFNYAQEMLELYAEDSRVMMIAGSNHMQQYSIEKSCCFTARVYTWGWATWRRAWEHYCEDDRGWKRIQKNGTLKNVYSIRTRYYVRKEFDHYFRRGKCPWDYLWWISCMGAGGLCAVPKVNLITNEGFGEDATHTRSRGDYRGETFPMKFPLDCPGEVKRDRKIDRYDRGLNPPWKIVRAFRKLQRMFGRQAQETDR